MILDVYYIPEDSWASVILCYLVSTGIINTSETSAFCQSEEENAGQDKQRI